MFAREARIRDEGKEGVVLSFVSARPTPSSGAGRVRRFC